MITLDRPNVYRGPRPRHARDVADLRDLGVTTVLGLQDSWLERFEINDEAVWVTRAGLSWLYFPMSMLLPPTRHRLGQATELLERARERGPVYVHCRDGVDRTGCLLWAHSVWHEGRSVEEAGHEMLAKGFHVWRYWWWVPWVKREIERGRP